MLRIEGKCPKHVVSSVLQAVIIEIVPFNNIQTLKFKDHATFNTKYILCCSQSLSSGIRHLKAETNKMVQNPPFDHSSGM